MAFKIPQLETCCCGCTLQTGSLIIGWLEIIGGIILLITGSLTAAGLGYMTNEPVTEEEKKIIAGSFAIAIILVIYSAFLFITAILLLVGINKKNPNYVRYWVIVKTVLLVIGLISSVVKLFLWIFGGPQMISDLIVLVLETYFLLVVYSYYRKEHKIPGTV